SRSYPRLIFVEIDPHHFALAHPHQIINEYGVRLVIRPNKHQPDIRLGLRPLRRPDKIRVVNFLLQNPLLRICQSRQLFPSRFHIDTQAGKGIEWLQHEIVGRFGSWKLIGKECPRGMRSLEERQRMFADPEIPVWMTNPDYVELFLKAEWKFQIRPSQQLIKNHAIIDAFNPDLVSCALMEQLPPTFCNIGER